MITVIGGGPVGCFYASKEKNDDVHILEEHKQIGKPVSCTGILTDSINSIVKIPKSVIVTKIKEFKIIAPDGSTLYVPVKKPNIIVDREKFDIYLMEKALDSGARISFYERFVSFAKQKNRYKIKTSRGEFTTDMVVGADGPFSRVAHVARIYGKRKLVYGLQARCRYPGLEEGVSEVRLGEGEFAWIVPENNRIARVGVIGNAGSVQAKKRLNDCYSRLLGKSKVIENQSGVVPVYNPKQQLRKGNVFLIGDAASQVKATTYGGIIYGMTAARLLARNKEKYAQNFKRSVGKDLWLSLKIREFLNCMNVNQYNKLVEIMQRKKNIDLISAFDRDYPSKFVGKLILQEPELWPLGFNITVRRLISSFL